MSTFSNQITKSTEKQSDQEFIPADFSTLSFSHHFSVRSESEWEFEAALKFLLENKSLKKSKKVFIVWCFCVFISCSKFKGILSKKQVPNYRVL